MDLGLKNSVTLVAGSSQGIGLEIATAFLEEGARTVITARGEETLAKAANHLRERYRDDQILAIPTDFTEESSTEDCIRKVVTKWSRIDHIVASVGNGKSTPDSVPSPDELERMLSLNLRASMNVIRMAHDELKNSQGSVVLISSIVAEEALGAPTGYALSKAALNSFAASLAKKWAPDGIRVNVVSPGNIFFKGGRWEEILNDNRDKTLQMLAQEVPMNRFGKPEEIAAPVVFLASQKASFITGSVFTIDGGQTRSW